MSSQSDGPYKSRLFNFINRQYIRSRDLLGKTGRQLKSTTEWGVQILLYPVYLIVQAGRMAGRQIGQKIERVQAKLLSGESVETADQPIEAVLKTVELWLSPQTKEESSTPSLQEFTALEATESTREKIIIRGVATFLETRRLVLVTTKNEIINILSEKQQQKLKQAITWETANFKREQRLSQKLALRLPKITKNNPNLLLPVQLFWEVMSWMEGGSLARSIDLFGESNLVTSYPGYLSSPINSELVSTGFLAVVDNTIADLEKQDLSPKKSLDKIQALIKAAVDYFFNKPGQQSQLLGASKKQISAADDFLSLPQGELAKQQLSGKNQVYSRLPQSKNKPVTRVWLFIQTIGNSLVLLLKNNPLTQKSKSNTAQPSTQPDPFEIQVLIQAAINYFFGKNQGKLRPRGKNQDDFSFLPETERNPAQLPPGSLPDPWLSWEDLYGEETPVVEEEQPIYRKELSSAPPVTNLKLPSAAKTPLAPKKSPWGIFNIKVGKSEALRRNQPEVKDLVKVQKSPQNLVKTHENTINVAPNLNSFQESGEDFIETEVTQVGYDQHFLEKILTWLDRAILWIEELLAKIWRRLRGR